MIYFFYKDAHLIPFLNDLSAATYQGLPRHAAGRPRRLAGKRVAGARRHTFDSSSESTLLLWLGFFELFSLIFSFCSAFSLPYLALTLIRPKMAWLGIIFFNLHGYARSHNLSCLDQFIFLPYKAKERRKPIWFGLESNRGLLASYATALTTTPCNFVLL